MTQKLFFTSLFLGLFTTLIQAQPVLQNTVVPNIGDAYQLTEADTINVTPGNAGANQTWNFSGLHLQSGAQVIPYVYIAPAGTPYATSYPTANIVAKIDQDTASYAYFKKTSSQFTLLGSGSLNYLQDYSDPDVQLQYPTNYNGSFQENFAYTTDAGTGIIFYSKGSRTTKYDAYGTLITPLGTFPNAMRIKAVSSQMDSASFSGIEIINQTDVTTFGWLVAGHPGSLASVYYIKTTSATIIPGFDTLISVSPVTKSVNYVSSTSVGVSDLNNSVEGISGLTLGPNPAVDQLTLRFEATRVDQNLQLRISDAVGRVLQTEPVSCVIGENVVPVPVEQLPAGAYFLTLTNGRGAQTVGWQKQ